ncbi:MAG TPA: SDR family oxidoreductase [Candidatus Tyrphobacter sp.]
MRPRRALVTGAASGLAAGTAPALARDGFAHVAITFRAAPPDATLSAIRAAGATGSAHRVDFCAAEQSIVDALAAILVEAGPFDTLVHAVGPIVVKRFARLTQQECREMLAGNFESAVLVARAVLPSMREAGFGRLIFFGANGSNETRPTPGLALYGAAKSAVTAFARTLAIEEARNGVTVNVIEPGDIRDKTLTREDARSRTAANPRGRPGSFEDVADVVRFLVAPERDFVTGAVIGVTGGLWEADEKHASSP